MAEPDETPRSDETGAPSSFIRTIIDEHLQEGRYEGVITRFPPEPNGYLHIGHAKSICLNFGLAADYGGACHLRFDDTNPTKEEVEYVESIQHDIRWLGFDWGEHLYFASDYFEKLYGFAIKLIEAGKAYVDSQTVEEIREGRGTLTTPGTASPYRDRPVAENLDLFRRMRAGEFPDGSHVLRARIDMSAPNMLMRDPILYRILHAHHHRTGDAWCVYPMYDFTHCLSDAIEGISHSICTLEFENNRELYDWVLDEVGFEEPRPHQYEFARLALGYTMMSKRKLLALVKEGVVDGWDDPRMPTLAGMRRRGVTPEAIRDFAERIGVAKANSMVDFGKLEFCIRNDLNHRAPRVMAVLRPLKVVITNYPEGVDAVEELDAPYWPHDVPREGSRKVPFSRELYIERDDFMEAPPKKWHRLAPGREVRLRYGYYITCDEVVRDPETGEIAELRCTYDPATRGGGSPDGRKVKGTLHWVSAARGVRAEVRLYDRLFAVERPGQGPEGADFHDDLNPESLTVLTGCVIEPSLAAAGPGEHYQFERQGYFFTDPTRSKPGAPIFNRVVELKDSWAKIAGDRQKKASEPAPAPRKASAEPAGTGDERRRPSKRSPQDVRLQARAADPGLQARYERYMAELALSEEDADVLTGDPALADFFDAALAAHASPRSVANWVLNELMAELKDRAADALPFEGAGFGELVALVDARKISGAAGKEVLAEMLARGGSAAAIVAARGLEQITDAGALEPLVDRVLAEHPDEVARYRGGQKGLFGYFVGQVMKASGGAANPELVTRLLRERLG